MKGLLRKDIIKILVENVIPEHVEDREHFSERLKAQPGMIDAEDFGWVKRPRLWWTDANLDGAEGEWTKE